MYYKPEGLTDAELSDLERLTGQASPGPWVASIEGRDHTSGDDVILVGGSPVEDMYVSWGSGAAVSQSDPDFIAAARNYMPRLLDELRRLRGNHT